VEGADDDVVWSGEDDVAVGVEFEDEVVGGVAFGDGEGEDSVELVLGDLGDAAALEVFAQRHGEDAGCFWCLEFSVGEADEAFVSDEELVGACCLGCLDFEEECVWGELVDLFDVGADVVLEFGGDGVDVECGESSCHDGIVNLISL